MIRFFVFNFSPPRALTKAAQSNHVLIQSGTVQVVAFSEYFLHFNFTTHNNDIMALTVRRPKSACEISELLFTSQWEQH